MVVVMRLGGLATSVLGLVLFAAAGAGGEPARAPVPKTDEELLAFSLRIEGCVGVVQVLKRTIDSGPHGEYTEFLDVKPMRWFAGACATAKLRLYSQPQSSFGFLSTGDWEVGPRDTVVVFTYRDRNKTYVSQTPHTLWNGLAKATPERIQFLDANVPRILDSLSHVTPDTTR
jgi:hypothetical protein